MIEELLNTPAGKILTAILLVAALIGPGVVGEAVFAQDFFRTAETPRLILLAIALAIPFFIYSLVLAEGLVATPGSDFVGGDIGKMEASDVYETVLGLASLLSLVPTYFPSIIKVVFNIGSVRSSVVIAFVLELLLTIACGLYRAAKTS